ncbi:hypothetical protein TrCOL_g9294 [Triparma columacea]|uniref:Cyclic nucleotide-binding domain-containing protein n=1 Tax=Triparma columacea TaxID=722753 RepID=A0A9W7GJ16_9STRA|nr:hypothetical protein TrCOL_g9294 [Triparma columacea]
MPGEEEKNAAYDSDAPSTEDEDSEDDYIDEAEMKAPPSVKKGRRGTVMAAAVTVAPDWAPPVFEKSEKEKEDLINSIGKNILFSELESKELDIIIRAMKRIEYKEGDNIIEQGAEGDLFYVVEEGECEIFVKGVGKVMEIGGFTSKNRNYFGELALLYDAPRAATVTAAGKVVCWGLDRVTFKQILQDSTQKQRHLYKKFLEQVPVLSPLSVYERLTIADALAPQHFKEGDKIIVEGSEGYEFFIVESGSVICTKLVDGVEKTVSETLGPGDYFGELSLINNENRAATVTAQEDTTCLSIDRKTFKRLLGPLEGMLREHQELYAKYVEDAKSAD